MNMSPNKINIIFFLFLPATMLFSETASTDFSLASVTMSAETGKAIQAMEPYISSSPASITTENSDGTWTKTQRFTSRKSKTVLPTGYQPLLQTASLGFYTLKGGFIYVSGSELFSNSGVDEEKRLAIINGFDNLMSILSQNNNFVEFFRKIHLNILNELYEYLMNIYTNFNLQNPGASSTNNVVSVDLKTYLTAEETYSFNAKVLIINHFINLIEEQFNSSVTAIMPSVPQLFATKVGKTTVYADYSVDLTSFILQEVSADLENMRSSYLNGLNAYLTFFKNYTALISLTDDSTGFNQFCTVAENIDAILTTTDMATMMTKMNPPIFFYNTDTMRALKLIPALAKKIPADSQSIGWPTGLVTAATNKIIVTSSGVSHPVAYFTNAENKIVTSEAQATNLYACIQSGSEIVQETILKQPDWLNTEAGILNILRACMGDFTALLGMGILDCCMESLINNALNPANKSADDIATTCQSLINSYSESVDSTSTSVATTVTTPTILAPTLLSPTTISKATI